MELLLNNGAPTEKDSVDGTPLQIAASRGQIKSIKLLLKYGAEVGKHNLEMHSFVDKCYLSKFHFGMVSLVVLGFQLLLL